MTGKRCFITLCGKSEREVEAGHAQITKFFAGTLKPSSGVQQIDKFHGFKYAIILEFNESTSPQMAEKLSKAMQVPLADARISARFCRDSDAMRNPDIAFAECAFIG